MTSINAFTSDSAGALPLHVLDAKMQAWTAADADKSGAVSKEELTGFLTRGA